MPINVSKFNTVAGALDEIQRAKNEIINNKVDWKGVGVELGKINRMRLSPPEIIALDHILLIYKSTNKSDITKIENSISAAQILIELNKRQDPKLNEIAEEEREVITETLIQRWLESAKEAERSNKNERKLAYSKTMENIETTLLSRLSLLPTEEALKAFDKWSEKANESNVARLAYMKTIVTPHTKRYIDMAELIQTQNEPILQGTTDAQVEQLREHYETRAKALQVMLNAATKARLDKLDEQTIKQTNIQRLSRNEEVAKAISDLANTGEKGVDLAIKGMSGIAKIVIAYQINKEKIKKLYIDGALDSLKVTTDRIEKISTSTMKKYEIRSNQVLQLGQIEQDQIANDIRKQGNEQREKILQNQVAVAGEGRRDERGRGGNGAVGGFDASSAILVRVRKADVADTESRREGETMRAGNQTQQRNLSGGLPLLSSLGQHIPRENAPEMVRGVTNMAEGFSRQSMLGKSTTPARDNSIWVRVRKPIQGRTKRT